MTTPSLVAKATTGCPAALWVAGSEHGNDYIEGGEGDDGLWGDGGDDILLGRAGETLVGENLATPLNLNRIGMAGGRLYGGAGNDMHLEQAA